MLCDNSYRARKGRSPILTPACSSNNTTKKLTIYYQEQVPGWGEPDQDTLHLCGKCADRIKRNAENHGYTTKMWNL